MTSTSSDPRPLANEIVDQIIARYRGCVDRTGDVLSILEEAQRCHPQKYLPVQTTAYVARQTGLPRSQIMSVLTFYAFFNRRPQGRHTLTVCRGTACHTRGSRQLLEALKVRVGAPGDATAESSEGSDGADGENRATTSFTTPDGRLTIRTVACFGQCAQAPVVAIDETIHGRVSDFSLRALIAALDGDDLSAGTGVAGPLDENQSAASRESTR